MNQRFDKKLISDYREKKIPTGLRPFIGENYNGTLIIASSLLIKKNSTLSTVDTPFESYENPEKFYSGLQLTDEQEAEISVVSTAGNVKKAMESNGGAKTAAYAVGAAAGLGLVAGLGLFAPVMAAVAAAKAKTDSKNGSTSNTFEENLSIPMRKAGCSIDDIAIHRFFMRPVVFSSSGGIHDAIKENVMEDYFVEEDLKHSIDMLKNVIDTLCPETIIFSSAALAKKVAEAYGIDDHGRDFNALCKERGILSDLNLTWDVCQDRINEILKSEKDAGGQRRLRLLSDALCKTVENIRKNNNQKDLDDLYIISDSIRLLVEEYKDKLKTRGTGPRNLTEEQRERRREIGRMKKPRKNPDKVD